MACGEGCDSDAVDCVCGVEVDCLDHRQGRQVVLLGVKGCSLVGGRGGIAHADVVLDQPFVDGLGGMGHEDPALEIGLAEHVGEGGGVIQMETSNSHAGMLAGGRMNTQHVKIQKRIQVQRPVVLNRMNLFLF